MFLIISKSEPEESANIRLCLSLLRFLILRSEGKMFVNRSLSESEESDSNDLFCLCSVGSGNTILEPERLLIVPPAVLS